MTILGDHPIRGQVQRILDFRDQPAFADPSVATAPEFANARDRVFATGLAIQALLEITPAELVSLPTLAEMAHHLQGPIDQLGNFVANKNPQHLVNAASQVDQNVQPLFRAFTPLSAAPSLAAEVLDQQGRSALQTIQVLRDNSTQLESRVAAVAVQAAEFSTKLEQQLQERHAAMTAQAAEFSGRLEALTTEVVKDRAEAAAQVAKLQQTFAENETVRAAAFNEATDNLRGAFRNFQAATEKQAVELLASLESKRADAAKIVQVVGNIGVTGNYQRIANAESIQANFWRWVTLGIFFVGVFVAGATFVKFWGQPFTPENIWAVAVRLLYAIAITAPAWYTAKESARHRTNTDRARQTELELASIGPFIELMPEDKKTDIREQLSKIYFGRQVEAHSVSSPLDLGSVKDLVVETIKAARK
jgi:hypothetical protein